MTDPQPPYIISIRVPANAAGTRVYFYNGRSKEVKSVKTVDTDKHAATDLANWDNIYVYGDIIAIKVSGANDAYTEHTVSAISGGLDLELTAAATITAGTIEV